MKLNKFCLCCNRFQRPLTVSAEKAHFDLDEFFEFGQDAAAGDEEDDMVAVLDNGVGVVPHNDSPVSARTMAAM